MDYQVFTHKGKKYKADDKGHGTMYVTVSGDALKLDFTGEEISVEKLSYEKIKNKKNSIKALGEDINYDYNICVDCAGLKCNKDIVETSCGNLKNS